MPVESEFDSAEQDTLVGSALEKYEILQKIGEGSIGTIYRGRDTTSGEEVAIKFLTREVTSKPQILARFKREIQTAIKMRHPYIVRGYNTGVWEGCIYYYVMEFVDGPTLQELLSRQKIDEDKVLTIAFQITSALQYIHEFGMVHRDLKPENIMINPKGEAKLADLGLAKDINDISGLTMVGTIIGTPLYMSPEQAKGAAVIDIRSDIYSLGATLFHAVTGEPPFTGRTAPEVIAKQIEEIPPPVRDLNPSVSGGLEFVIHKMLEKDPGARYQTPKDLIEDLHLLLQGKGDAEEADLPWSMVPVRGKTDFRFSFYPGDEDFEYGLTAAANGLIDQAQMAEILDFQEEMARHEVPLKIAHIAVERGYIKPEDHRKIREAQNKQREMEQGTGIGKLAIKKEMATKEQVQEALRTQKKLRKEKKFRLLGEILKKNKVLDDESVRKLLALQNQVKFGKEDREFLELAKQRLLLSTPVAEKVLLVQKNELAMTRYRRVGDILVDRKFLPPSARDTIMRALRRSKLTGEDRDALMEEKETGGEIRATEEIKRDNAILKKYRSFIEKKLKAGKTLKARRKFREAIDAWRAILEVLVRHAEAEKLIQDTENIMENMDAHEARARNHFQMALREWEGILRINPRFPPAIDAMLSARDRVDALLDGSGAGRQVVENAPPPAAPAGPVVEKPPPGDATEVEDRETDDNQKIKRMLRSAKRFEKQGNKKEARKRFLEILEIDPENEDALAALKTLQRQGRNAALVGCLAAFLALAGAGIAAWFLLGGDKCTEWIFFSLRWMLKGT